MPMGVPLSSAGGLSTADGDDDDDNPEYFRVALMQQLDKLASPSEELATVNGGNNAADKAAEKQLIEAAKVAAACERELAASTGQVGPRRSVQALEAQHARLQVLLAQAKASTAPADVLAAAYRTVTSLAAAATSPAL